MRYFFLFENYQFVNGFEPDFDRLLTNVVEKNWKLAFFDSFFDSISKNKKERLQNSGSNGAGISSKDLLATQFVSVLRFRSNYGSFKKERAQNSGSNGAGISSKDPLATQFVSVLRFCQTEPKLAQSGGGPFFSGIGVRCWV